MEKDMDTSENINVDHLKDIRNQAQALVQEQDNKLHGAQFLEATAPAVSEINDDDVPTDPALIDALKHECDSLESQILEVQKKVARMRKEQNEVPQPPPKHLRKIQVLEAKRRAYAAELSELQKREPTFVPEVQTNPEYIKSTALQEAESTVAQLEDTIQRKQGSLALEREGLEREKTMFKELESISKALDIRLKVLDRRGDKLTQIRKRNHKKELERRQSILDQDIGRVANGLISFLDKHFTMTDSDYQQFTHLLRAESSSSHQKEDDDMSEDDAAGDAGEGSENKKSRKRRRSEAQTAPNDDYNQAGGDVKKPVLSMKAMLQELMNKSLTAAPWVNWVNLNWFEWFVQMLISAGIAEEHPNQHGLIRLSDFL